MRDLLGQQSRHALAELSRRHTLIAFDFDGTLSPIVPHRQAAVMRRSTRALLGSAASLYPCAVISGRSLRDVTRRVGRTAPACIVGNHGAEWPHTPRTASVSSGVRTWARILRGKLKSIQGVEIEGKGVSLSIHYRAAADRARARRAIARAVKSLSGARSFGGKQVVNVMPVDAPDKGAAIETIRRRFSCETALYVGDDTTDESVFALKQAGRLLAVRVGRSRSSAADYYLRDQGAIDRLLRLLISLRREAMQRAAREDQEGPSYSRNRARSAGLGIMHESVRPNQRYRRRATQS